MPVLSIRRVVPAVLRRNDSRRKSVASSEVSKFGFYHALHGKRNDSYTSLSSLDSITTSDMTHSSHSASASASGRTGETESKQNSSMPAYRTDLDASTPAQDPDADLTLRRVKRNRVPVTNLTVQLASMEFLYQRYWCARYQDFPPGAICRLDDGDGIEGIANFAHSAVAENSVETGGAEGAKDEASEREVEDAGGEVSAEEDEDEAREAKEGGTWLLHRATPSTPAIILSAAEYDFASPAYNNIWWNMDGDCLVAPWSDGRLGRRKPSQRSTPMGEMMMMMDGADRWLTTVYRRGRMVQPAATCPLVKPTRRSRIKNKLKKLFK